MGQTTPHSDQSDPSTPNRLPKHGYERDTQSFRMKHADTISIKSASLTRKPSYKPPSKNRSSDPDDGLVTPGSSMWKTTPASSGNVTPEFLTEGSPDVAGDGWAISDESSLEQEPVDPNIGTKGQVKGKMPVQTATAVFKQRVVFEELGEQGQETASAKEGIKANIITVPVEELAGNKMVPMSAATQIPPQAQIRYVFSIS